MGKKAQEYKRGYRMNQIELLLKDITFNSRYEFLEKSKIDEVAEIAKKRGIQLPAHDLAPFKCIYAFTDRKNLNGCTLPEDEVKRALKTLVGKAIDFDHVRQRVIGHWIGAKLENGTIIAYGVFYKGNFPEDYKLVKDLMKKGKLKVSFEAWGNREFNNDGSYSLNDIEFSGGGLLLATKPAFKDAEVIEMAANIANGKERILELAKVCTEPECYIKEQGGYNCSCPSCGYKATIPDGEHCSEYDYGNGAGKCPKCGATMRRANRPGIGRGQITEKAKLYFPDDSLLIQRIIGEIKECPYCKVESPIFDISLIDLENDKIKAKCTNCGAIIEIDLEPNTEVVKKGKKIKEVKVERPVENAMNIFEFLEGYKGENYELIKSFIEDDEFDIEKAAIPKEVIDCVKKNSNKGDSPKEVIKNCWAKFKKSNKGSKDIDIDKIIEEAKKLSYQEKKNIPDSMFAIVITKKGKSGKTIKIRKYPLNDETRVRAALRYLGMPRNKQALEKLGISIDSVKRKILKRAKELNMKELLDRNKGTEEENMEEKIKELEAELAKAKEALTAKTSELEKATATINELKKESEEAKKKIEDIEKAKAEEIEKAKADAKIVAERKAELKDFAKDISDEDILDDVKYENAKLKMELANKEKELENAKKGKKQDFTKGSKDKEINDPIKKSNAKVRKYAWGV